MTWDPGCQLLLAWGGRKGEIWCQEGSSTGPSPYPNSTHFWFLVSLWEGTKAGAALPWLVFILFIYFLKFFIFLLFIIIFLIFKMLFIFFKFLFFYFFVLYLFFFKFF